MQLESVEESGHHLCWPLFVASRNLQHHATPQNQIIGLFFIWVWLLKEILFVLFDLHQDSELILMYDWTCIRSEYQPNSCSWFEFAKSHLTARDFAYLPGEDTERPVMTSKQVRSWEKFQADRSSMFAVVMLWLSWITIIRKKLFPKTVPWRDTVQLPISACFRLQKYDTVAKKLLL